MLKGPGAFMYGIPPGGSVGGSINIVTKRALDIRSSRSRHNTSARQFRRPCRCQHPRWTEQGVGHRFNGLGRTGEASINDGNWQTGLGAVASTIKASV